MVSNIMQVIEKEEGGDIYKYVIAERFFDRKDAETFYNKVTMLGVRDAFVVPYYIKEKRNIK